MADQKVAQLGPGAACCGWNHCGRRLAAGAVDGSVSVYNSQPSPSTKWQVSLPHHNQSTTLNTETLKPHMAPTQQRLVLSLPLGRFSTGLFSHEFVKI